MYATRLLPRVAAGLAALVLVFVFAGCASAQPRQTAQAPARSTGGESAQEITPITQVVAANESAPRQSSSRDGGVMPGIDVLESQRFAILQGKRIGLLTHPAGVNRFGVSTIDVIRREPRLNLVALYGPEHGIYGDEIANEYVPDRIDARTGLHVFSLYGETRWPTPAMLEGIDVMVIDLQDVGTRSYTYVSCMRYTLERCFENGVEVVVLDRPNPLGGLKVAGPMLDREWLSYVGAFRVPYVHGLTIGELARIAASEPGVLKIDDTVRRKGRLTVVPMRGWKRSMTWPDTGLKWIPTSPNIPSFEAVVGYSMTGLGAQLGGFRHGIGTPHPFRFLMHPELKSEQLASELKKHRLHGLRFVPRQITDAQGRKIDGLFIEVRDWDAWRPTELNFHMMQIACKVAPKNPFVGASPGQTDLFNKHVGSTAWWNALTRDGAKVDLQEFLDAWDRAATRFQNESRRYWLYR
ncbi:MAG: DUF1343 domain-containing protein [Opitutaceae bacterium]